MKKAAGIQGERNSGMGEGAGSPSKRGIRGRGWEDGW